MADSEFAIRVEHLGKRYQLRHETSSSRHRYVALRDIMAERFQNALRSLRKKNAAPMRTSEEFWALRDVSLEIQQGEAIGIIGRNGAGKSTFLKLLSRIAEPSTGRMQIRGRVATLLEVGTGFHPELTARENIFLNGAILGMTKAEISRQFDDIVAFAEVERFLDTPVKRFSSGMYMRLAFAVAAHLRPEILLLDEVLAVGDAQFQQKCLGRMQAVATGGRTVLFVSHSMAAIRNLCQRVIWLDRGSVRAFGETSRVIDAYVNEITENGNSASELGEIPRPGFVDLRARVKSLIVNGGTPVFHGEPFILQVKVVSTSSVPGLSVGFGFSTIDGTRLVTFDSDLTCPRHDVAANSQYEFEAAVESLPLQPGHYSLDLGLRSGDSTAVDYLQSCAQITILPGRQTPSFIANGGAGLRLDARWAFARQTNS